MKSLANRITPAHIAREPKGGNMKRLNRLKTLLLAASALAVAGAASAEEFNIPAGDLEAALNASHAAGLPDIQVTPNQGKLLWLLASTLGAKNILEIGTLGGYSTIWLARALPSGGRLVTLEVDPQHARIASANIARAGLADVVDLRLGAALDTLPQLALENRGPFDLTFIDADKENNTAYVQWAIDLGRPGTVIVVDNVVRHGRILNPEDGDRQARGVRDMLEMMSTHHRLDSAAIQTLGLKGWDGFAIALVT